MTLFYPFYKLLLSRDTFHRFNRAALLSIVCFSMLLPLCKLRLEKPPVMQLPVLERETARTLSPVAGTSGQGMPASLWIRILPPLYAAGALFFLGRFAVSSLRMFRLTRQGAKRRNKDFWLIITPEALVPCSWMHYILISGKDWSENGEDILAHEMAHIKNGHFADLLFAEVCVALHWFNPAAWLLRRELQHVHEYEADESVIQKGVDAKRYQLLLIKKAVGARRFASVSNSFNHSTLKKRISMMLKRKSNPWARLKYLYVLPLAVCAITAFARPGIPLELKEISATKANQLPAGQPAPPDTVFARKMIAAIDTGVIAKARVELEKLNPEMEQAINHINSELEKVKGFVNSEEIQKAVRQGLEKARPEIEKAMSQVNSEEIQKAVRQGMEKAMPEIEKNIRQGMEKARIEMEKARTRLTKDKLGLDKENPLILLDGKEITTEEMNNILAERIESISVLKDKYPAIEKYGEKAAGGVIVFELKKEEKEEK